MTVVFYRSAGHFLKFQAFLPIYLVFLFAYWMQIDNNWPWTSFLSFSLLFSLFLSISLFSLSLSLYFSLLLSSSLFFSLFSLFFSLFLSSSLFFSLLLSFLSLFLSFLSLFSLFFSPFLYFSLFFSLGFFLSERTSSVLAFYIEVGLDWGCALELSNPRIDGTWENAK